MIHLTLGRIQLDWGKNSGFADHSALFRPGDLTEIPYYYAADKDDPETARLPLIAHNDFSYRLLIEMKEGYSTPLKVVARRLLLLGHTDAYCSEEFEVLREIGFCRHDFSFGELKAILANADFSAAALAPDKGSEDFGEFFIEQVLSGLGTDIADRIMRATGDSGDVDGLSAYTISRHAWLEQGRNS